MGESMEETARIPIVKQSGNLLVSIQVALTDRLVDRLKDEVTREIKRHEPRGLIIDVSGLDIMDSYISRSIRDIGLIADLMGVRTVICGLSPAIALTLVEMGMGLEGVTTVANLDAAQRAIERAVQSQAVPHRFK